jgi:excinuclease ABC subunit B
MNTPASTKRPKPYTTPDAPSPLAGESDPTDDNTQQVKVETRTKAQLRKDIREAQRKMQLAAKEMDFLTAAKYRDEIKAMQAALDSARGE